MENPEIQAPDPNTPYTITVTYNTGGEERYQTTLALARSLGQILISGSRNAIFPLNPGNPDEVVYVPIATISKIEFVETST